MKMTTALLESLIQNYGFKKPEKGKLPTMDYVYPSYTADGNTEEFRFSEGLRRELGARAGIVKDSFKGKSIAYTFNESMMYEVAKIAPRLGLEEQLSGNMNSIYAYPPLLFVGSNGKDFKAYVVKPVADYSMAWFELTDEEAKKVHENLEKKAEEKPYRSMVDKLLGYFR
jgi:hypothetical protein